MKYQMCVVFYSNRIIRVNDYGQLGKFATIAFSETSLLKNYSFEIDYRLVRFNDENKEDPMRSFDHDKCWIRLPLDYIFRLKKNNEDSYIEVGIEEVRERMKERFESLNKNSEWIQF